MTDGALWLDWEGCRNVRDAGGVLGGRVRLGALVRSDSHCFLTDAAVAAVRAYGVSRIVDLRRADECEAWPSRFAGDPIYRNLPLQDPSDPSDSFEAPSMTARYTAMLDQRPELFAAAVAAIADAPPGAVVVQCAAGKDRTGLVVALALALAGVPAEPIAADYALSDEAIRQRNDEMLAGVVSEEERARWRSIRHARPETMLETLAHLDEVYGGARGYLVEAGLDELRCDAVPRRLLGD
ncbi:tyrosine-protein phosphatase [Flindersiella endophytica]